MSHGRIARASRRHPDAKRRSALYGRTVRARRPAGLPPHLLPGVTQRGNPKRGIGRGRLLLIGAGSLTLATLLFMMVTTVVSTVAGVGGTLAAYEEVNENLPNAAEIAVDTFQTSRIYDRNGTLLQEVDNPDWGWRSFVPLDQVAQDLIDATVAAEDATFWTNYGVEPFAIVRGAFINVSGQGSSGGSTITQQLVRWIYPEDINALDISYSRKGREALAAWALNRQYSKHDIMTMYLNQIYYGNRAYGIEAAAEVYFNKRATDLTLAEASLLAGLPQSPTRYNPALPENFERAKHRQRYVLDQMVKYRYITRAEADAAFEEPLQPKSRTNAVQAAPHFVNYIHGYVASVYGPDALTSGGLRITTSIDVDLQRRAEEIVRQGVAQLSAYDRNNGAMVVMVPWSGEILAMVGSANFNDPTIDGQVNHALARLQPGSSIKPIGYAAAFEAGWNPATIVMDSTFRVETPLADQPFYEPQNYTGMLYGAITVRDALANSLNIPAVKAVDYAGVDHMIDLARRMGMENSLDQPSHYYGLSLALGGGEVQLLEHTNVYATFANNGRYVPANPILKVEDAQGNVLYEPDRDRILEDAEQALKAEYAYQITDILTDDSAREMIFTANNLFSDTQQQLGQPVAAKSGTTDNWRDIWTMGYTTDLAVGVWVGKSGGDNSRLPEMDGIQGAGPIWQRMMIEMHETPDFARLLVGPDGRPLPREFPRPDGIYEGEVCVATGHQATSGQSRREVLVRGEGPTLPCNQLSAYEREELQAALQDVRQNAGKYVGGAIDSIYRYSEATGGPGRPTPSRGSGGSSSSQSGSGSGPDSGSGSDADFDSDSGSGSDSPPPIVPTGGDDGDSEQARIDRAQSVGVEIDEDD